QAFDPERLIDFSKGKLRSENFVVKKHYFSIYSHYGQSDKESADASKRKIHVIRSGDTLGGLARRYGTTVSAICRLNGFSQKKMLRIGERIIVR
ncbi:MAG: LysM peptidoglycan-binding domain-containing protein, partial [Marinilabiliaceae bacterium]